MSRVPLPAPAPQVSNLKGSAASAPGGCGAPCAHLLSPGAEASAKKQHKHPSIAQCAAGLGFSDLLLELLLEWKTKETTPAPFRTVFQHHFIASMGMYFRNDFNYLHYEVILVGFEIHLLMIPIAWMLVQKRYKKFPLFKHQPWRFNISLPDWKRNLIFAYLVFCDNELLHMLYLIIIQTWRFCAGNKRKINFNKYSCCLLIRLRYSMQINVLNLLLVIRCNYWFRTYEVKVNK